jgi:predicted NACHT family NTPase
VGPDLDVPLHEAIAPLKLISGNDRDSVELFLHSYQVPRVVILGGPRTGKTTLTKNLIISVLNERSNHAIDAKTPVFISLRDLATKELDIQKAIIDALQSHNFPNAQKFVRARLDSGRFLIVLDGLDEVRSQRPFVRQRIQDFCRWDEPRELAWNRFQTTTCVYS